MAATLPKPIEGVQTLAVINRIAGFADDMTAWRRHLHARPEIGLDCHDTAAFVVARLREFGIERIETGVASSGVVAVIEGRGPGPVTGLRADMDALPIAEETGLPHASTVPGAMHACGHDGHTAMLLGAARYLAETRNFTGRVVLIFQPAEEGPGGARVMVEEGVLHRHGLDRIFALHTLPGLEAGRFSTCTGPIMAAVDTFDIEVTGRGGHAAFAHDTRDPVVAACGIVQAIQTITSRNLQSGARLVVGVSQIHTGTAENVVPERAHINGTIRSFDPAIQDMAHARLGQIAAGQAAAYGVAAELRIERGYPATINHATETAQAVRAAAEIAGEDRVEADRAPEMGAEDFASMLNVVPGAYVFLGQGPGPGLHQAGFDFNDDVAPAGASFFARLVERHHAAA